MMILSSLTLLFAPETKGLPLTQSYKDMKLNSFTKTSIMGKFYSGYIRDVHDIVHDIHDFHEVTSL